MAESTSPPLAPTKSAPPAAPGHHVPFGVNEMRLNARHWSAVVVLLTLIVLLVPRVWKRVERFTVGTDYRIPYTLSKDYWLYQRRLEQTQKAGHVFVLGDSVVWGEYVRPDGTLSHFLNSEAQQDGQFVNIGVNGLFPLALEGLTRYYGTSLHDTKVLVQCNVLWMSSPKADLQTQKEEKFNHSRLVPQFAPKIPCYRADVNERLGAMVERNVQFIAWVGHLQSCYFEEKSILNWTLEEDSSSPPTRPNAYKNPLAQITGTVPSAPENDPQRGPQSPRHKAWNANGNRPAKFEWVTPESSFQWAAFQRLVRLLRERHNDVLVVVGPFNEHIIADESKPGYTRLRDEILRWLQANGISHVAPGLLPSELYADASHPLTEGYALLGKQLYMDATFQHWLTPPAK